MNKARGQLWIAAGVFACLLLGTTTVSATVIGPGSGIAGASNLDGAGERLNIDRVNFESLGAGTYNVLDVSFNFAGAGIDVIPFLAVQTDVEEFTTIWVGGAISSSAGVDTTAYAPGSELFFLAATTNVFAGFWQEDAVVFFNNVATLTAHDNDGVILPVGPGDVLDGFSHFDLNNRTYAYEISVARVPEPGALLLLGVGLLGLAFVRKHV